MQRMGVDLRFGKVVEFQNEALIADDHTAAQPVTDGLSVGPILGSSLTDRHALVADFV